MRVLGSAVLLVLGEQTWVARRTAIKPRLAGCLECPGGLWAESFGYGGVETPVGTALREVREKTGLVLLPERLRYRGSLHLEELDMTLYSAELGYTERPKDTEPAKRDRWMLTHFERLRFVNCTPSLGALLAVVMDELRLKREKR